MKVLSVVGGCVKGTLTFVPVALLANDEPHVAALTLPEGVWTVTTMSCVLSMVAAFVFVTIAVPDVRRPPPPSSGQRHAWHLYVMRVAERRKVYDSMRAAGIGVQVHHVPIPTLSVYRAGGSDPQDYPHATAYYEGALSLPLYPGLTEEQQDFVVACLGEAVGT